jgi:predicted nucleic acid-binding protein
VESARVGIILDSSVIASAERTGHSVRQILERVQTSQGEIEISLSLVTIAELVHGAYRAKTAHQQEGRLAFIERLCQDVPVHPVTLDIARLAGRIEGQEEGQVCSRFVRRLAYRRDRAPSELLLSLRSTFATSRESWSLGSPVLGGKAAISLQSLNGDYRVLPRSYSAVRAV